MTRPPQKQPHFTYDSQTGKVREVTKHSSWFDMPPVPPDRIVPPDVGDVILVIFLSIFIAVMLLCVAWLSITQCGYGGGC